MIEHVKNEAVVTGAVPQANGRAGAKKGHVLSELRILAVHSLAESWRRAYPCFLSVTTVLGSRFGPLF